MFTSKATHEGNCTWIACTQLLLPKRKKFSLRAVGWKKKTKIEQFRLLPTSPPPPCMCEKRLSANANKKANFRFLFSLNFFFGIDYYQKKMEKLIAKAIIPSHLKIHRTPRPTSPGDLFARDCSALLFVVKYLTSFCVRTSCRPPLCLLFSPSHRRFIACWGGGDVLETIIW